MDFFKSFKANLFSFAENDFEAVALNLFKFQAQNNPVYRNYLSHLKIDPGSVNSVAEIPFLPIEFFKTQTIKTGEWSEETHFVSSGVTGPNTSVHRIEDLAFYLKVSRKVFSLFYGSPQQYHILALLPSYLERQNSSLVYMVDDLIKESRSAVSGFYLYNHRELIKTIENIPDGRSVLLFGATFALLDLAEKHTLSGRNLVVMETGGMKGRRKEYTREETHEILKDRFNVKAIHSEYGMTELLSQAYSRADGKYFTPPWMKAFIREVNDPFHIDNRLRQGGINIVDLANAHSCAFIETKDLGHVNEREGYFTILGRFDNADIRGCNLLVA